MASQQQLRSINSNALTQRLQRQQQARQISPEEAQRRAIQQEIQKLEQENNQRYDKQIDTLQEELGQVQNRLVKLGRVGRSNAGLVEQELKLKVQIQKLDEAKDRGLDFSSGSQFASSSARGATQAVAQQLSGQRAISQLQKDLGKETLTRIQRGESIEFTDAQINRLSPQTRNLLQFSNPAQQQGYVEVFDPQGVGSSISGGTLYDVGYSPAPKQATGVVGILGGTNNYIQQNPVLSRIAQPSKIGQDIRKIPYASPTLDFFEPPKDVIGIYNPILALATPIKTGGIPKTKIIGTVERQRGGSVVKVMSSTRDGSSKPTLFIGKEFVKNVEGTKKPSVAFGYTFQKSSQGKFTNIKKIESASVSESVGKAKIIKESNLGKITQDNIGRGNLIRTRTLSENNVLGFVSKRSPDESSIKFIGGKPTLKVDKSSGNLNLLVRDPSIKGMFFEVSKETGKGVKSIRPSNVKKTPFSITYQEEKSLFGLASSAKSAGEKGLKDQSLLSSNGRSILFSGVSGGNVLGLFNINTRNSNSFNSGFNKVKNKIKENVKAKETKGDGKGDRDKIEEEEELFFGEIRGLSPLLSIQGKSQPKRKKVSRSLLSIRQPQRQSGRLSQQLKQNQQSRQKPLQLGGQSAKQSSNVRQRQISRLYSRQLIQTRGREKISNLIKQLKITPPQRRPPSIGKTVFQKKNVKIKKINGKYSVYVKRFGVDSLVGTFEMLIEAKTFLESILSSTLARSGGVIKDRKKIKVDLGFKYRSGKKEPTRVVQKRKYSLSTSGEKREIFGFKRRAKKDILSI